MDVEKLVDAVTKVIMERLNEQQGCRIVAFGEVPDSFMPADCEVRRGTGPADVEGCDYIVMTADSFRAFHGGGQAAASSPAQSCSACCGRVIDLMGKRLIHERDLRDNNALNGDVVRVAKNAIITALAHDYAKGIGVKITRE